MVSDKSEMPISDVMKSNNYSVRWLKTSMEFVIKYVGIHTLIAYERSLEALECIYDKKVKRTWQYNKLITRRNTTLQNLKLVKLLGNLFCRFSSSVRHWIRHSKSAHKNCLAHYVLFIMHYIFHLFLRLFITFLGKLKMLC